MMPIVARIAYVLTHGMKGLAVAALAASLLAACETASDVADAANPANWFEEDGAESAETKPAPGEEEDFPELKTVPDRPDEPEVLRNYEQLRSGLVADNQNARYSDEAIRREAPPDTDRANAARAALQQEPAEPPTAETVPEQIAEGAGAADGSESASVPTVAPEPEPTVAPAPAPAEEESTASTDTVAPEAPQPAPEPEPLTQSAGPATDAASEEGAPQRPEDPPESAAPIAAETDATTDEMAAAPDAPDAAAERLIATIYFPDGGSRLTGHDQDVLRQVADIFNNGGKTVRVVGHSSSDGASGDATQRALVNYKTSLDRASAVAGKLVDIGIPRDAVSVDARGAKEPRYAESTDAGIAGNRRTEIYIGF